MRGWFPLPIITTALLVLSGSSKPGARQEVREIDGLEGINVIDDIMTGGTIYLPRIKMWPIPDILLNPVIARIGPKTRQFFLRALLRGVDQGSLGVLTLTIDGVSVDLDLNLQGNLRTDTSGCSPRAEGTLEDEDGLVRRISAATNVQAAYRAGTISMRSTLMPEDFERFRRIVALYDAAELPPAGMHPKQDFKDGHLFGPTAGDISNPELIVSSKVLPVYPPGAIAKNKNGSVILVARILKDGTVGTVRPVEISAVDCGFVEAAVDAVKQWRYTPARRNGQPVEVDFTIVTDFLLSKPRP